MTVGASDCRSQEQMERRNRKILRIAGQGMPRARIASAFKLSRERVRQIVTRNKELDEDRRRGGLLGMGLSRIAFNTLRNLLKVETPTVIDLSCFLRRNYGLWEQQLRMTRQCGKTTVDEIREFAVREGMIASSEPSLGWSAVRALTLATGKHGHAMEFEDVRQWLEAHREERHRFIRLSGAHITRRTLAEIDDFARRAGIPE